MEVTDGNLSWAATLDISGISKAKDTLVKYFKDMGLSAEEAGKRADEAMENIEGILKEATKEVKTQAEAVEVLKDAYEEIQEQLEAMEDGTAKEVLQGVGDGIREIVEEMEAMSQEDVPLDELGQEAVSARQQLREMTEELVNMKMRGEENTEAYQRLLEKVGVLKDAMADTQQAVKGMASDTAALDSVLGAAQLTAGGFSAIIGAMNLVGAGEDTKELAEAQKKLQAAIAVTTGLQSVQNALQKQSAVMLGIQKIQTLAAAKAEDIKTAATGRGVIATKAATVAQKAFNAVAKANPYVLLAMAILTVVGALAAFTSGAKENERQQKSLNDELERQLDILNRLNGVYNTQQSNEINNLRNILDLLKAQGASIDAIRDAEDQLDNAEEARIKREKEDYKDLLDHAQEYEDKLEELRLKAQETNNEGNAARETAWPEYSPFSDYSTWEVPNQHPNWIKDHADALVDATVEDLETYEKIVAKIHQIQQDDENYQNRMRIKEANRLAEDKERRDKEAREAAERRQKNLEEERRYQEELRQARERAEDLELENKGDSVETRVERIQLQYDRQIAEAMGLRDAAKTDELKKVYQRLIEAIMKAREKAIETEYAKEADAHRELISEILGDYMTYNAKREAITKKYQDDIETMRKEADTLPENSKERLALEEAIAEAQRQQSQELLDLEVEYGTLNQLIAKREELEKQLRVTLDKLGNTDDEETIRRLREEIERLKKELAKVNKEIEDANNDFEESSNIASDFLSSSNYGQIIEAIDKLIESLELCGVTSKETSSQISDMFSLAKSAVEGYMSGGAFGMFLSLLNTGLDIANRVAAEAQKAKKIMNDMIILFEQLNLQLYSHNTIFGDDALGSANEALRQRYQMLNKIQTLIQSNGFTEDWNGNGPDINLGGHDLEMLAQRWGTRLMNGEVYNTEFLKQFLEQYGDDLSEQERIFLNHLINYSETYKDDMEAIASYLTSLFGDVADTIADQMIDSFMETGQAAMDMGSIVSDITKRMAKDFIKSLLFDRVLQGYQQWAEEIMLYEDPNDRAAAFYDMLLQMADQINNDVLPDAQAFLEAWSAVFGDTVQDDLAMSGNLLQSASQDSVDLLNGQLNAIRTNQSFLTGRIDDILLTLAGIRNDMNDGFSRSIQHLENIDDNTSEGGSILRQLGIWIG